MPICRNSNITEGWGRKVGGDEDGREWWILRHTLLFALGLISCNCMLRWASHEIPILVFVIFECFLSLLGQPQNLKIYVYSSCCNNTYVMFTSLLTGRSSRKNSSIPKGKEMSYLYIGSIFFQNSEWKLPKNKNKYISKMPRNFFFERDNNNSQAKKDLGKVFLVSTKCIYC